VKRHVTFGIALALAIGLTAAFAGGAVATPSKTSPCSGCHDPLGSVVVSASVVSSDSLVTTYSISVNNPLGINGWAVFNGSTKVAGASGNGTDVVLPNGPTYTVFGVSGDGSGMSAPHAGYASTTVHVAGPASTVYTFTYRFKTKGKSYKGLKAVLKSLSTGQKFTVAVNKKGVATFKNVVGGSYKLSTTGNSKFKFKAITVKVGP
jgi:hypothetical protein